MYTNTDYKPEWIREDFVDFLAEKFDSIWAWKKIKAEIIHLIVGILIFGTTYIMLSYRYNSYWLHIARDFIIHHKGKKICVA